MAVTIITNLLDALVLGVLKTGDTYGYILTQRAKEVMDISDSTLYPVLRRLQKDDALSTYDAPFQGRNRRYYSITDKGKTLLAQYITDWDAYKTMVEKILTGGFDNEQA